MLVLGIDPGSAVTGFGLVERCGSAFNHVAAGAIRTSAGASQGARLQTIFDKLSDLINSYTPAAVSLERSFVARNVQSAFRLGEARAMALLAASKHAVPLFEYTPAEVKLTVASYGGADKEQIKFAIRRTLGLDDDFDVSSDAADALAMALCHLAVSRMAGAMAAHESRRRSWRARA